MSQHNRHTHLYTKCSRYGKKDRKLCFNVNNRRVKQVLMKRGRFSRCISNINGGSNSVPSIKWMHLRTYQWAISKCTRLLTMAFIAYLFFSCAWVRVHIKKSPFWSFDLVQKTSKLVAFVHLFWRRIALWSLSAPRFIIITEIRDGIIITLCAGKLVFLLQSSELFYL